jgi:hypothetical protein
MSDSVINRPYRQLSTASTKAAEAKKIDSDSNTVRRKRCEEIF